MNERLCAQRATEYLFLTIFKSLPTYSCVRVLDCCAFVGAYMRSCMCVCAIECLCIIFFYCKGTHTGFNIATNGYYTSA